MKFLPILWSSGGRALTGRVGRAALLLAGAGAAGPLCAQPVPRAVVVEHFTNTLCGICASRNPGFYANLRQQPGTLHIAYHPSSPYRACVFNQQNVSENDARTNFYGIYGSTPRLVVNGSVIPATQNFGSPALFAPFQGQTSALALLVTLRPQGPDSLTATVRVETRAAHNFSTLQLNLALAEDTVVYAAPNGEQRHYDVFRKNFNGGLLTFGPAPAVGGVVTLRRTIAKAAAWQPARLYALAIVQNASLTVPAVVQAAASARLGTALPARHAGAASARFQAYPNPAISTVSVPAEFGALPLELYNGLGQRLTVPAGAGTTLDVRGLGPGPYLLRAVAPDGRHLLTRFVKE